MKHQDPLDESREWFVDGLIDQSVDEYVMSRLNRWDQIVKEDHQRHMEEKGRLLKERCAMELDRTQDKIIQRDLRVDREAG